MAVTSAKQKAPKTRSKFFTLQNWWGMLWVLPSLIAVMLFVYGFIGWTARVSVSAWKGLLADYTYVGFENFTNLASDPRFSIDIQNTAIFTVVFVLGCLSIGLGLAILLDKGIRAEGFFRSLFLFPMAISFIVTGVVWRWLMNPAQGDRLSGLNLIFDKLGLDFLINQWHGTPTWGIAAVAIPAVWQMSGYTMALYLAGLRAVPESLREAARVDGASEFQVYRKVIMKLIRPVTLSAIIILGHISLKVFDLIIAMAGKQVALDVPSIYMWTTTFDGFFFGRGAAIGIVLLLSVAVLVIPYLWYTLRQEADS
ncbi:MAG: sugar ABC transporter permease [Acidimicrobiia bacterium]|nr:sugar ABC transporter permease [Acidimicrobiia bacterium]